MFVWKVIGRHTCASVGEKSIIRIFFGDRGEGQRERERERERDIKKSHTCTCARRPTEDRRGRVDGNSGDYARKTREHELQPPTTSASDWSPACK